MKLSLLVSKVLSKYFLLKSSHEAHESAMKWLRFLDDHHYLIPTIKHEQIETEAGDIVLPHPMILAAGFVKGEGFSSEDEAMRSVTRGENIIPGWRSMPSLAGTIEIGTFTPCPRLGNTAISMWRNTANRSLYNRVGLKNPGVRAASVFLAERQDYLPSIYGISLAADPDTTDMSKKCEGIASAINCLMSSDLKPSWITLNLSCPNAGMRYGESPASAEAIILSARKELSEDVPLWVKISPDMKVSEYRDMVSVFESNKVSAIIAVNSSVTSKPDLTGFGETSGMSGEQLKPLAVAAVSYLSQITSIDIIGCGGIMKGSDMLDFRNAGAKAFQYWSALVYKGFAAARLIHNESEKHSSQ